MFARSGPGHPNRTEPQPSPPLWDIPFSTGHHNPWNVPVFFPTAYIIQASTGEEFYSVLFYYLNWELFLGYAWWPEESSALKADRRGNICNFEITKTTVSPLNSRALFIFKNSSFYSCTEHLMFLLWGLGIESPWRRQAHVCFQNAHLLSPFPYCLQEKSIILNHQATWKSV